MAQWRKAKRARNKYIKGEFDKLSSGQDLVSDQEKLTMEEGQRDVANQTLQAQQQGLARAAMGAAGGNQATMDSFQQASQDLAGATGDAAIKASAQTQQMATAMEAQRRAAIMGDTEKMIAEGRSDARHAQEMALKSAEIGAEVVSSIIPI